MKTILSDVSKKNSPTTKDKLVLFCAIFFAACCILLFSPQIQNVAIKIVQQIIGRNLRKVDKWIFEIKQLSIMLLLADIIFLAIYFDRKNLATNFFAKHHQKILVALCAISTFVLVWFATISAAIWMDEAYSLSSARHSFWELVMKGDGADISHPPAYHAALSLWNHIFGDAARCARIFSVLPIVLLLWACAFFLQKEFSTKSAIFFVLLLLSSWRVVYYSAEIRMYSWAACWVLIASLFAYYFMNTKKSKWLFAFVIAAVCGAYTHYYAAICLACYFVFLAIWFIASNKSNRANSFKESFITIFLSAIFGVALYSPWLVSLFRQLKNVKANHSWQRIFWEGQGLTYTIRECLFDSLFCTYGITRYLFFIVCIFFALRMTFQKTGYKRSWILANFLLPFVLIFVTVTFSLIITPILVPRYVFPAAILIILFASIVFADFMQTKFSAIVLYAALTLAFLNCQTFFRNQSREQKNYEAFRFALEKQIDSETIIVFPDFKNSWVIEYFYLENTMYSDFGKGEHAYPSGQLQISMRELPEAGDFFVIVIAEYPEGKDDALARIMAGGREDPNYIYKCTTKTEVTRIIERHMIRLQKQRNIMNAK